MFRGIFWSFLDVPTVRADILGHFPDILGQRQFQATWYHIFQVACHIRKCFKQ